MQLPCSLFSDYLLFIKNFIQKDAPGEGFEPSGPFQVTS
jgi:hypothetical protein